jgi:hypothetical protein
VVATGTEPLSYYWRFNGTDIITAAGPSFAFRSVQITNAGNYSVLVSNFLGTILSSNAILRVNLPPVADARATVASAISVNSSNANVVLDASRSLDPDGDALQYSWLTTDSQALLATGRVAMAVLPVGTNFISLEVSDGLAFSEDDVAVTVFTLARAIQNLMSLAASANPPEMQSLKASLAVALAAVNRGNRVAAINDLRAFENKVEARAPSLDPALIQSLIQGVQQVIAALNGG